MIQQAVDLATASDGLTIQQVAAAYGVSERTIRRRIKAGSLTAEKVPTAQGYEWRVRLDNAGRLPDGRLPDRTVPAAGGVDDAADEVHTALVRALGLVERLQRENLELAGRVGFLQGKLQETQAQPLALAPPAGRPPAAPAVPAEAQSREGLGAF